jgi:hypothetical protein
MERNDVLVNTSTLAWKYTRNAGIKEKHEGEDLLHIIQRHSSIQKLKLMKNKETEKNGLITQLCGIGIRK